MTSVTNAPQPIRRRLGATHGSRVVAVDPFHSLYAKYGLPPHAILLALPGSRHKRTLTISLDLFTPFHLCSLGFRHLSIHFTLIHVISSLLTVTDPFTLPIDSVTENHFFSLSCLLYPHVRATPNYTLNPFFDRAWPQHLYLNPDSPLVPHLKYPEGFNISTTPLVTFRRVDLLLTQNQLRDIYRLLHPDRVRVKEEEMEDGSKFDILGGDAAWEVDPEEYLGMLTSPDTNYGTIVASTGGHWTVGTFPGLKDTSLPGDGIQNVLDFFEESMPVWATLVQSYLKDKQKAGRSGDGWTKGGRKRRVVVRAYLPGHDGCHYHHEPWKTYEQADMWLSYNWGQIGTFNQMFEVRCSCISRWRGADSGGSARWLSRSTPTSTSSQLTCQRCCVPIR